MRANERKMRWGDWFKLSRIIPISTIIVGAIVVSLILSGTIQASLIEGVIISLLTLLSIDALTERLNVLERIEAHLKEKTSILRRSNELGSFNDYTSNAQELLILAVSGTSIIGPNYNFLEEKIKEGCRFKILLLDPSSTALSVWDSTIKGATTQTDINSTLKVLQSITKVKLQNNQIQVKLLPVFLPFSMVVVNPNKTNASMIVEFHSYKTERNHVFLTRKEDDYWFHYYLHQFNSAWNDA